MELTLEQLKSYRAINNQVLIKITRKQNEIEYGKLKLYYDASYDDFRNAVVTGTVVAVPEKLKFGPDGIHNHTTMDLKEGDSVWFHYMAFVNAMPGENQADKKYYKIKGEDYYCILVKYDSIFVAKRDQEVIPLNGYCLIEPQEGEDIWKSDIIQQTQITKTFYKHSLTYGTIRYLGSPITKYANKAIPADDDILKVGDKVAIDHACDIPLEVELHQTFKDKPNQIFYRVLRKDILGIIEE